AVSVLEHSLSIQKNYSQTYYLLAVAKDQLGDREGAISALEKAREVVPEDWVSAFQLGILYSREGYVEKAKEMGEIALQLNPKEKNIHLFLASLYDKLKERDKAILEIENLSKEFPENEAYQKMLENLKSGKPIFEGIEKEKLPIFAF
ncbi:hypothetical protein H5T58_03130, partial [Candidatus Parcubacteria bacterium]|nr:hypothetical protein [Candidatus Parcubacteria bacterium]